MKKRYILLNILLSVFVGIPLILHISWNLTTPRELNVLTINKSVTNFSDYKRQAHHWVLTNRRFSDKNGELYQAGENHLGFMPMSNKKYRINDLANIGPAERSSILNTTDLAYFVDNYGVFSHDWYNSGHESMPYYKVYGGLCEEDIDFIGEMLQQQKVVIGEYNFFGPPTPEHVRHRAEELLDLQWNGWTVKYLPTLDSSDVHFLPTWLVKLYREQNQGRWPFTEQGIAFIHQDNTLLILEYPTHLNDKAPMIITGDDQRKRLGLPKKVPFPGWFEVTQSTSSENTIVSLFEIPVNTRGEQILRQHNIPLQFPAVIENHKQGKFYYFAGDFGKNHVSRRFVRLKGARYLELLLTDLRDPGVRNGFFFSYYLPLTTGIYKESGNNKQEALKIVKN